MTSASLRTAYDRLCAHELFAGQHVSLDRDRRGDEQLHVGCDWLEAAALAYALEVGREMELEVVMTDKRLRFAEHSDELSTRVRAVKATLADDETAP